VAAAKPAVVYSIADRSYLSLCMTLSISAREIAEDKLQGQPADRVKAGFAGDSRAPVLVPLVDQVYSDNFTDTWDYTGSFYKDCGDRVGHLSPAQIQPSMTCMYKGVVAAAALATRETGTEKSEAYGMFSSHGDLARPVIDGVYAPKATPGRGVVMDVWNSCMDLLTRS
jgi:hypothetical protein